MGNKRTSYEGPLVAGIGLILLVVCCATWVTLRQARAEELKPRPLPALYPSAQNIEEKVIPRGGEGSDRDLPMRVVSFSTSDRPEDVLSYYLNAMTRVGWQHWETTEEKYKNDAYFSYHPDDAPAYSVFVKTSVLERGQTAVTVEMFAPYSDWHGEPITEVSP